MSKASQTILLTGATGFLGHYTLRELLADGHRVVAMVRPPVDEGLARLKTLMLQIGVDLEPHLARDRLHVEAGCLPESLPRPSWGRTDAIVSCAASLQLYANGNPDPFRTNVAGMESLIGWAVECGVDRIFAVSTAYTCGWNSGVISEALHRPPPEFQTDYEKSKWESEELLATWSESPGRVLTILRPSFLVGDSATGYTTQFAGFYQFLRMISLLKQRHATAGNGQRTHVPLRIPGRPTDRQNLVPVDFCARMIAAVVNEPAFHGRIYHLTNPDPPTNEMLKSCYEEYFGLDGGYFADPAEVVGRYNSSESFLWGRYEVVTPRIAHNPVFDTTNTRDVMAATGVTFPTVDRERILALFDFAVRHDWGRQAPAATVSRLGA